MSYTRSYTINGYEMGFTDWGILLDPGLMRMDEPGYIEALKQAREMYDEVNNINLNGGPL